MTLGTLREYLRDAGFTPLLLDRFMCWPWGVPGELTIERCMKHLGLRRLLLNQIAVAMKPTDCERQKLDNPQ